MSCEHVVTQDLCRKRGDTRKFSFTIRDASGTPIDITGSTFRLGVDSRDEPDDASTQLFVLTGSITNGPGGVVEFGPLSSGEANQSPDDYYYDLEWTDSAGEILTIVEGVWRVEEDRTK